MSSYADIIQAQQGQPQQTNPYAPTAGPTASPYAAPTTPASTTNVFRGGSNGPAAPTGRDTAPPVPANPTAAPGPGGPSTSNVTLGGGWQNFATTPGTPQYALMEGLLSGQSGQALIDQLNTNPATAGISYNPASNEYGLPNGYYVAPDQSNPNQLDLIQRGGGGGAGGGTGTNIPLPTGPVTLAPVAGIGNDPNAASLYSTLMQTGDAEPERATDRPNGQHHHERWERPAPGVCQHLRAAARRAAGVATPILAHRPVPPKRTSGRRQRGFRAPRCSKSCRSGLAEIQSALSGASGLLTNEQSMQLQQELAQLQDALQLAGLEQGAYQFQTNTDLSQLG